MSHTKPIKLGRTLRDIMPAMAQGIDYPHLHLDDIEDERLADLPVGKEGTAEIRFKVVRREQREEDQGEKKNRKRYSVTLEIISIEPGHDPKFNGKAKTSFMDSARDGFNKNFK